MKFGDVLKKSVMEGFNYSDFSTTRIVFTLLATFVISLYIFFVYKNFTRSTFYNKGYAITMSIISVVTAGIVLAMQSSLVISLGMVGALSIIRFRTAIKEPLDLLFLFWSIGTGIISGAGLFELSIILAIVVTIGLLILQIIPVTASPELLIVKLSGQDAEEKVMTNIKNFSPKFKIDSKSITKGDITLIIELKTTMSNELVNSIAEIDGVINATLMQHDGEVKN